MNLVLVEDLRFPKGTLSLFNNVDRRIVEQKFLLGMDVKVIVSSQDVSFLAELVRRMPEKKPILTAVVGAFNFSSRLIFYLYKSGITDTVITDMPARLSSLGIIFSHLPTFNIPKIKGSDKPSILITRYNTYCAEALCRGFNPTSFDMFIESVMRKYMEEE